MFVESGGVCAASIYTNVERAGIAVNRPYSTYINYFLTSHMLAFATSDRRVIDQFQQFR
ncbi:MAG: hypothetical protein ACI9ND_003025 [Yoonia sp.]|jgi:hypothetical protein